MDKVQKPIDSGCYTQSSEPFRVYLINLLYQVRVGKPAKHTCTENTNCQDPFMNYNVSPICPEGVNETMKVVT
jgi:hypothetical protein